MRVSFTGRSSDVDRRTSVTIAGKAIAAVTFHCRCRDRKLQLYILRVSDRGHPKQKSRRELTADPATYEASILLISEGSSDVESRDEITARHSPAAYSARQ